MTCGDDQHFDNIHLCDLVGVGGNLGSFYPIPLGERYIYFEIHSNLYIHWPCTRI